LGIASGINFGKEVAIFEAVHGSAPDIAGKGIANPTALLKSAILMLQHMGDEKNAQRIEKALDMTLLNKDQCTGDLGGKANTNQFAQNVISNLDKN
jgi:isocitrate dehydrogenase (NAD+)